ncbi:MAG: PHB depolymerase family esterase [Dehalococcoidia bacterium]
MKSSWLKFLSLTLVAATLFCFLASCTSQTPENIPTPKSIPAVDEIRTLVHDGRERTYLLHVPDGLHENEPGPLVFAFHGGGGNGSGMASLTEFDKLADREEFIVVFPDGVGNSWNDGRQNLASEAYLLNVDDVGFVDAMIETISLEFPIDRKKIYATGISNGAIFSHFLAAQRASTFAAIAPVAGGLAIPFNEQFNPDDAVSVLMIQGTDDPLVPYNGGQIAGGNRGTIISTDDTVELWVQNDGCNNIPLKEELPNSDLNDGCLVTQYTWSNGRADSAVVLLKIEGGGHTWPSGAQYLPESIIGRVCKDFEATEVIWSFFKDHPKQ